MSKTLQTAVLSAALALFGATAASAGNIVFTITNDAPTNGLWIMRPWVGISDGGYTTYTLHGAASSGVKHEAEDGITGDTTSPYLATPPGNACGGTGYTGSDCLYQTFNNYRGAYSQTSIGNPTAPGATISGVLNVDPFSPNSQYLSYLVMAIPSNDAFFGTATNQAIHLFDASGNFLSNNPDGTIVLTIDASDLLDAGTEANNECANSAADVAFLCQSVNGTGLAGEGTVEQHAQFGTGISGATNTFPPGSGIHYTFQNINDAFTTQGAHIATVTITLTPEPATYVMFGLGLVVVGVSRKLRKRSV